jgi:hypothetical protein
MANMDYCKNRFDQSKCDPWIIETFECYREIITITDKGATDYTLPHDYPGKADIICSKCKYFDT